MKSACGLLCNECPHFEKECIGCFNQEGKPFWTEYIPDKCCALYDCSVNKKQFHDCGQCSELPCKTFKEQKDPNCTEEEHLESIGVRVERLKKSI